MFRFLKDTKMDVKNMTFENETFDCIIDKAMLDSIFCSDNAS